MSSNARSNDSSRTPRQIARQALKEAKDAGLIRDFAVRDGGRATIYYANRREKAYTDGALDTLALLDKIRGGER